jgi:GPH family glycoside/pentoside/hexuronide:cation symporter
MVWFVENAGFGAVGTMGPYLSQYVLRRPDMVGLLSGAYVVTGVLSIPLWVRISRSVGKRDTWLAAMVLAVFAFGGLWFVGSGDVRLTVALLALAGCATGCGGVLSSAILADLIDADERRTGERKEGVYSAAMTLVLKLGTSLTTAASGLVLTAMGFAPNVEQSAASLLGIRFLFAGLPFLGFVVGIFVFRSFPRDGASAAASPAVLRDASVP